VGSSIQRPGKKGIKIPQTLRDVMGQKVGGKPFPKYFFFY
jgi:hypothetical protein